MTDDTDDDIDTEVNSGAPAPVDRFGDVLALLAAVRSAKVTEQALKRLRKLERDIAVAESRLAAAVVHLATTKAELAQRSAAADERDAAIEQRETAFEAAVREARDHLRGFYDSIAQEDRRIRYRILIAADLLHGYNEKLQTLPDWRAIQRMLPQLQFDEPAEPPADDDVFQNVRTDWSGSEFMVDSTLTRVVKAISE
jgi:septal ring factor EnvC (AmiA/AmiB activator)